MGKITSLEVVPLNEIDGEETVVVVKNNVTKRAQTGHLAEQAARPWSESAQAAAASVNAQFANVLTRYATAAAFTNPGFVDAAGVYAPSAGWFATGFVRVEGGQDYRVGASTTGGAWHAWYDENQFFISAFRAAAGFQTAIFTAPANARFARVSTQAASQSASFLETTTSRLSIDMITAVMAMFPQNVPATRVTFGATNVNTQLLQNSASIIALTTALADAANEIDAVTDHFNANFVDLSQLTRSYLNSANPEEISIVSRDSATQFTVASGKGAVLTVGGAVVVWDGTADVYSTFGIRSISGDVVTVFGQLPAACTACMTVHDTTNAVAGQHASLFFYRALADDLLARTRRTSFRKASRIFAYHPPNCRTLAFNNPNVYRNSDSALLFNVTALNGAIGGGWVAGTSNSLPKSCAQTSADAGIAGQPLTALAQRFYEVADAVAGRGIEFSFPLGGFDGFVRIRLAAARVNYTGGTTDGRVRLEFLIDGVVAHDATYDAGEPRDVRIGLTRGSTAAVRMTLADNAPTVARLYGVYAWKKAPVAVDLPLIADGDVVLTVGDSWTQFPMSWPGLTKPPRVDGGTAEGLQIFTERLKERAAALGRSITVFNYGRGGTTTRHTLYWLPSALAERPTTTVVIDLGTGINDLNSSNASPPNPHAWSFSPTDRWTMVTDGTGVNGRVTNAAEFVANKARIAKIATEAGKRVITYTPPHTASIGQAQSLVFQWGHLLAAGFEVLPA